MDRSLGFGPELDLESDFSFQEWIEGIAVVIAVTTLGAFAIALQIWQLDGTEVVTV